MTGPLFAIGVALLCLFGALWCFAFAANATEEEMRRNNETWNIYRNLGPEAVRKCSQVSGILFLVLAIVLPIVILAIS